MTDSKGLGTKKSVNANNSGIENLINHFVQNFAVEDRRDLKLNRCADH